MKLGHAFNVIAMLQMLARQGPCRCSPILRLVLLARHEHDQQTPGVKQC